MRSRRVSALGSVLGSKLGRRVVVPELDLVELSELPGLGRLLTVDRPSHRYMRKGKSGELPRKRGR